MNGRIIWAIARKDWLEVRQNRMAWMPTLVVPLIFCIVLPLIIIVLPTALNVSANDMMKGQDIRSMLGGLPPAVAEQLSSMNDNQLLIYYVLGLMFAPLFLIMPIMTAGIIGSDSFVGEKERKTMEALLYTPATDRELFTGKLVAAVIPAVLETWLAFIVYALVLNLAGGSVMGGFWFPTATWWPLILWVTPAVAFLGILGAVIISSRVNTFMEAYQSTGLLVLPIIALVIGQVGGVVYLSVGVTIAVGVVVWLIDAALLWFSLRIFNRAALVGGKA
jgi:ABC-type Na+ efflux pump permease subunit